jgi:hypothetical protein
VFLSLQEEEEEVEMIYLEEVAGVVSLITVQFQ